MLGTAWRFLVGISISVLGWQRLGCGLPPPCDSKIYCTGDLLKQVQLARLFPDAKHFVDMPLRKPADVVLAEFQQLMAKAQKGMVSRTELQQFVTLSFDDPGKEFEQWEPQDWNSRPRILNKISDQKLRAWASELNTKWKSLGRKIKVAVEAQPELYSLIYVPKPMMVPGGRFIEYYYWDSYWVIEGLLLCDMPATAKGMIQNFLYLVDRYGHIPNGGRVYYLRRSQPPFLALMMDAYLARTNDTAFLRENIHLLEVEYEFWQHNRSVNIAVGGTDHTLNRYNVQVGEPRPESYSQDWELAAGLSDAARQELWAELKSAAESGWDFSSRWFQPPMHAGTLRDTKASTVVPVDLNAVLCKTERLLAEFHRRLGNSSKAAQFQAALERRLQAVQAVLWDEAAGIWLDFNLLTKQRNPAFYPSNLVPLWAECFVDQAVVGKVLHYLQGSTALSYEKGLPTSLARTGQQWDMPNAWPPLQHMVIAGKRVTCGVWMGLLSLATRCCIISLPFLARCGLSQGPPLPPAPSPSLMTQIPLCSNHAVCLVPALVPECAESQAAGRGRGRPYTHVCGTAALLEQTLCCLPWVRPVGKACEQGHPLAVTPVLQLV